MCIHNWEYIALDNTRIIWKCAKCERFKYQKLLRQNHIQTEDIPRYTKNNCIFWHNWYTIRLGDYIDTRENNTMYTGYRIQVCKKCKNIRETRTYGVGSDGRGRPPVMKDEVILNPNSDSIF